MASFRATATTARFLAFFPPRGQAEPPPPQVGVGAKRAQDILRPTDQQAAEHRVPAFRDARLRVAPPGLVPPRTEPEIGPHGPALAEAAGVFEGEHVTEGSEQAHPARLAEAGGFRIPLCGHPLELALQPADLLGEPRDEFQQRPERAAQCGRHAGGDSIDEGRGGELAGRRPPQAFTAPRT